MYEVKAWFYEHGKRYNVPIRKMNTIVDQVNNSVVGIQAGGVFTLNYGTISQVYIRFGHCN